MKTISLFCLLLISRISYALSAIIATPGIQRKSQGTTCTFQWTVSLPLGYCKVENLTNGSNDQLSSNANYTADKKTGIVTLNIWNIQLKDAGNYSLSVTVGSDTQTNSGALLFVYGSSTSSINQTSGSVPAIQGETVELTCTVVSTSLPVAYRPKTYYSWCFARFNSCLKNISSGPAVFQSGDVLTGYSIKNDGRTLVIDSAQYPDKEGVYCRGQEEGSTLISNYNSFNLQLQYRPYTSTRTPVSGKYNTVAGQQVSLSFSGYAEPSVTSIASWSFVDIAGNVQNLPPTAVSTPSYSSGSISFSCTFAFALTSEEFYGVYSVNVTNSIGSTTETFPVLPPGPPDAPSNFRVFYMSHVKIALKWSVMWDNGHQQTITIQVNAVGNETAVATLNTNVNLNSYNTSYDQAITNNIQPDTEYEARIWSTNANGSSDVFKLTTRTPKQMILHISAKTISFNGSQAIIKYTTSNGNLISLTISCCCELTGDCASNSFTIPNNDEGEVIFNNLPNGNAYVFDFTAYSGIPNKYTYFATLLKGLRVSRTGGENVNPLFAAVVAVSVLLGLAVASQIGCVVAFIFWKRRNKDQPRAQPQPRALPQPQTKTQSQIKTQPQTKTQPVAAQKNPGKRMLPKVSTRAPSPPEPENDEMYELPDPTASKFGEEYTAMEEMPRYS